MKHFLKRIPAQCLTTLCLLLLALTVLADRAGILSGPLLWLLPVLGLCLGLWGLVKLIKDIRNGRPS